jgi:hypothetical protein
MTTPPISAALCAEMVAHAAQDACASPVTNTPPELATAIAAQGAQPPNLDALAVAVTSQGSAVSLMSTSLALLGLVIAVVALVGAVTWGYFVRRWALDLARQTVEKWMDERAPGEIAKLNAAISGGRAGGSSANDQARGLGEDPA